MTFEEALAVSSNPAAAMVVKEFGINPVVQKMKALGMDVGKGPYPPALVLGSGELSPLDEATGYNGLLLNKGLSVPSYMIESITKDGKVVYKYEAPEYKRVFEEDVAIGTIQAMNAVIKYGTAKGAVNSPMGIKSVAGKTGTADQHTDLWFTMSACDKADGGQTVSFWAGNPKGKIAVRSMSSYDVAQMAGRYINLAPHSKEPCDLTQ